MLSLFILIFTHPRVVSRHRDPQLRENYSYLFNLKHNICKSPGKLNFFVLSVLYLFEYLHE